MLWEGASGPPSHCGKRFARRFHWGMRGAAPATASWTEGGWLESRGGSSQVSTGHLGSPSRTVHVVVHPGMTPGMFVEQLAMLMISCARDAI